MPGSPAHPHPGFNTSRVYPTPGAQAGPTRQRGGAVGAGVAECAPLAARVPPHRQVIPQHCDLGGLGGVQVVQRSLVGGRRGGLAGREGRWGEGMDGSEALSWGGAPRGAPWCCVVAVGGEGVQQTL